MINVSRIDLNLLAVLEAIHTQGGVTRAAETLNLTQPTISHALSRLRDLFDDPVFVRQGHAMIPTPLIRGMIEPLRRSLRAMEATLNDAGRFDAATARRAFTLGMRESLEGLVLPALLRQVAAAAPQVDLAAVRIRRRSIEAELATGAVDVAIDVLLPLPASVHRHRVATNRLVVLARDGHPAIRRRLTLATYLRQEHVAVTSRRRGLSLEDLQLSRIDRHRRIRLRCQNYAAAAQVVRGTDLLLTVPEHHAQLLPGGRGHRIWPLPLAAPSLDSYLYWHETVDQDPANRWLRDALAAAFRSGQGWRPPSPRVRRSAGGNG